jgi:hypothetical protein
MLDSQRKDSSIFQRSKKAVYLLVEISRFFAVIIL